MRSLRVIPLFVVAWLVLSTVPALAVCGDGCDAGMDVLSSGEYLWPGQAVTWNAEVYTDKPAAGPDEGPFFAYLVEPNRRADRVPDVVDAALLGPVAVDTTRDPSLLDVSVTFTVPSDTPLGSYSVEVCDDPCTTRLAYIGPTSVEIVSGDVEARLNERIDRLELKVRNLAWSMKEHARRMAKRSSKAMRVEIAVAEEKLDLRVSELERGMAELEKRFASQEESGDRGDVSQSALAGGVVVFLLGAWFVRERRRNLRSPRTFG
jgi:chaperonin cofactor prefoldin